MRKCFIGHVGEASFREALAFIEEGRRATLFVHDGSAGRIIHFSPERILKVPWSPAEAEAARSAARTSPEVAGGSSPPGEASPARDAEAPGPATGMQGAAKPGAGKPGTGRDGAVGAGEARRIIRKEIESIIASRGAPFEVREGTIPIRSTLWSRALELRAPPPSLLAGIAAEAAAAPSGAPQSPFPGDPLERADAIASQLARGSLAAHVLFRELSRAWKEAGSPRRAARALVGAAQHYIEWCDEEGAVATLEEALGLSPADAKAAEQLIALHDSAGRHREAEAVAEGICRHYQTWKLHDPLARFYKLLSRPPESAVLRRIGAEAMVRTGGVARGIKEISAIAQLLEAAGDRSGARSAHERVLELDPANPAARKKLRGVRWRGLGKAGLGRWPALAAALVLLASWIFWDAAAASALAKVKDESGSDPREGIESLRREASRFPVTRQPSRLASLEEGIYARSLDADWATVREAVEAESSGDTGTAYHLYGMLRKGSLIPAISVRAEWGRSRIQKLESERENQLRHAAKLVQGRDLEAAARVYINLLKGIRRTLSAASYSVPVLVDSVPRGAAIKVDRKLEGETPRWIFLSSDPDSVLELSLAGFDGARIADPLAGVLESGSSRLVKSLVPEARWRAGSWGGQIATGARPDTEVLPVLGADGVLRGIDARTRKPAWEVPLDGPLTPRGPAIAAGPVIVLPVESGAVAGFAAASGKISWTLSLGDRGAAVLIGQLPGGQLAALKGNHVILLNPHSGLVLRRIDAGFEVRPDAFAVVGDRCYAADGQGGIVRMDPRSGKRDLHREKLMGAPALLVASRGLLAAVTRSGEASGLRLDLAGKAWEARVGGEVRAACASRGRVIIACAGGVVICLDGASGTPIWKIDLDGEVKGLAASGEADDAIAVTLQRAGVARVAAIGGAGGAVIWELEAGRGERASVTLGERTAALSSPSMGTAVLPLFPR